jgi:hypothetical protein
MQFYKGYFGMIPVSLFRPGDNWQAYLKEHLNAYSASQSVIASLLSNQKGNTRVLLIPGEGTGLAFYLRKEKIISVGDYFGPARFVDLRQEILNGNCLPYLTRFDISAVIFQPRRWPSFYDKFRAQLKSYGFKEYRHPDDNVAIFLRSDIHPSGQPMLLPQ